MSTTHRRHDPAGIGRTDDFTHRGRPARRRWLAGISTAVAVGILAWPLTGASAAQASTGDGTTLGYTASVQSWTVPASVHQLHLDVTGGAGGDGSNATSCAATGGPAGWVTTTVPVDPGEVLDIWVADGGHLNGTGGVSDPQGDFRGGTGGRAGAGASLNGGGGGGATVIWRGHDHTDANVLVVAGGGGGGGGQGGVSTYCGGRGGNGGSPAGDGRAAPVSLGIGGVGGAADQLDAVGDHGGRDGLWNAPPTDSYDPASIGGGGGGGGGGLSRCQTGATLPTCYGIGGGGGAGGRQTGLGEGGGGGAGGSSFVTGVASGTLMSSAGAHGSDGAVRISFGTPTSTTLSASADQPHTGTPVTFRALVDGADGSGSVLFTSDGSTLDGCAAVPFTSGGGTTWQASCTVGSLPPGRHSISAVYSGDLTAAGSAGTLSTSVTSPTTTTLRVPTGAVEDDRIDLTAVVAPTDGTGYVRFVRDGILLSGCEQVPLSQVDGDYRATCATTAPGAGDHQVTASYWDSTYYETSQTSATFTVTAPQTPLTVSSSRVLPSASAQKAYTTSLSAIGGVAPYQWARTAGTTPAGLVLHPDGTLSGTPTTAGSVTFTAKVTDATGATDTASFGLTVAPATTPAPAPDLDIAVTHGTATKGATGSWKATVRSSGSVATATAPAVVAQLPSGVTGVQASGTGWRCAVVGRQATCTRTGALAPGSTGTVTVRASVTAAVGTTLRSTWSVTPTDATPASNAATDFVTVRR